MNSAPVGRPAIDLPIPLLLDAQDIGGAAIGREKIGPVLAGEKALQRRDARAQANQIVLLARREDRADQIMAHALLPQVHLDPIGEEAQQRADHGLRPGLRR